MIEQISWKGWHEVYRISNGTVQVLVLGDAGPRIVWYGFEGGDNILHEVAADAGLTGGTEFRLYGGHRLWVSPEVERTYFPDNRAVSVEKLGNRIRFTAPAEDSKPGTNLQKQLEVELEEKGTLVHLLHRIINHDRKQTELAPWTPTMMRAGGRAILPVPPRAAMDQDHLLPVGSFAIWSYTDFADSRWRWGTEYIQLIQSTNPDARFQEQMGGMFSPAGWLCYFRNGLLFVKRAPVKKGANYPDHGCNLELFTNHEFLEVETLGPLITLEPGGKVEHPETWELFRDVAAGEDEDWIRSTIRPLVGSE